VAGVSIGVVVALNSAFADSHVNHTVLVRLRSTFIFPKISRKLYMLFVCNGNLSYICVFVDHGS